MGTSSQEFRFYYFTPRYEETVRFYRDVLEFAVFREWNRNRDRGTVFRSPNGGGLIEIEAGDIPPHISGGFYIEVDDLEARYDRLKRTGAHLHKEIGLTSYGHEHFKVLDPNGIEVCFFRQAGEMR